MFGERWRSRNVRLTLLLTLGLTLAGATSSSAATFQRAPIAPDLGLDALTRGVARAQLGRDVFSEPYAAVTIGNVDVYPVFPYVESRTFEIVSDPRWNRLVYGEAGRTLRAYDGAGQPLGALKGPRGLAVDERNRLYVADTGNDRILVLDASTEFGDLTLVPVFEIKGLAGPYAVAYSDGGTPFRAGDDVLYVADTGHNRIAAYALGAGGATFDAAIGELGSGVGRVAGPMAITAGRAQGAGTPDVYVADAHTRRLVHLVHSAGSLRWAGDAPIGADLVTSLDTDQWGNVYAAAPRAGLVRKFNPSLVPVADLASGVTDPHAFHVPFVNVNDHRSGTVTRAGRPNGLAVERWDDTSGMQLWNLGLELANVAVSADAAPEARFALTDRAAVSLDWLDPSTGRALAHRDLGTLDAGPHAMPLDAIEAGYVRDDRTLRVTATSSYENGATVTASTRPSEALPSQATLLGHSPNPMTTTTRIAFALPATPARSTLDVYDAGGRRVRRLGADFGAGLHEVIWDGADDQGRAVAGGIYFYRLEAGSLRLARKLVVVR